MEDFPVLLLFLIFYLVSAFSGNKKKKRKKGPMRTGAQGERMDMRAEKRTEQTKAGFDDAFSGPKHTEKPVICDMNRMHLHETGQMQFVQAGEGEDPCHVGGQPTQAAAIVDPQPEGKESDMLAQDVLRGVVMSEILMRPHERAAIRRGRR